MVNMTLIFIHVFCICTALPVDMRSAWSAGDSHFVTPSQPSLAATWALPGQLRQQRPPNPHGQPVRKPSHPAWGPQQGQPAFSQPHQAAQAALGIFDFQAPNAPAGALGAHLSIGNPAEPGLHGFVKSSRFLVLRVLLAQLPTF